MSLCHWMTDTSVEIEGWMRKLPSNIGWKWHLIYYSSYGNCKGNRAWCSTSRCLSRPSDSEYICFTCSIFYAILHDKDTVEATELFSTLIIDLFVHSDCSKLRVPCHTVILKPFYTTGSVFVAIFIQLVTSRSNCNKFCENWLHFA